MSIVRTVARNTGALALGQTVTMLLRLLLVVFAARCLGDTDFGKLGFAQSFTALLVIFADMGLSTLTVREIARNRDSAAKYLVHIAIIKIGLSLATFGLIQATIKILDYPADTVNVVCILGISTILSSSAEFLRAFFRAYERMEYEAFLNVGKGALTTGVGLLVLAFGHGLVTLAMVYFLAAAIDLAVTALIVTTRFVRPAFTLDIGFLGSILPTALPFSLTAFIGLVYSQSDMVMISLMKGDAPAGWYKAATVIIFGLMGIPNMFSFAVYPLFSRLYISSTTSLSKAMEKSSKYLYIVSLPIALGLVLLANRLVFLFYGPEYVHTIPALRILALYLPLRCINNITGYALASINMEPAHASFMAIAASSNVLLNLLMIPFLGIVGASISTIATEALLFILYYHYISRFLTRIKLGPIFLKPSLACIPMCVPVIVFQNLNLFLLIGLAAIIYITVLYFIKGLDAEDKSMLRNLCVS